MLWPSCGFKKCRVWAEKRSQECAADDVVTFSNLKHRVVGVGVGRVKMIVERTHFVLCVLVLKGVENLK